MMKRVRERMPSVQSLKAEDVNGFRNILHILLEKYENLGEIDSKHLEPHEREALEMFREFEKRGDYRKSGGRLAVLG